MKLVLSLLICLSVVLLSGCGSATDPSLLPAYGAGRIETEATTPEETDEPDVLPKNGITILIDPGHGFEDGGTGSELLGDVLEKDITLSVSKKLEKKLIALGFDVMFTHNGEKFPTSAVDDGNNRFKPEERVSYANSLSGKFDYYISIHCNSFDDPEVSGIIIYHVEDSLKGTAGDTEIAETLKTRLSEDFADTKVSTNIFPYYVIRYTKAPASLIEMGFVTNETDAANMLDEKWQEDFAASLANGLNDYYNGGEDEDTSQTESE